MLKWGRPLRVLHFLAAIVLSLATVFGPDYTAPWLAAFWGIAVSLNVLCGGCFITRLERQMTGEDITIIDPLLILIGGPITKGRRNFYTLMWGVVMLFIGMFKVAKQRL